VTGSGGVTGSGAIGGTFGSGAGETCGPGGCVPGGNADPIDPPGPVLCGGVECGEGQTCCLENGECFDPQADPGACAEPLPDEDPFGRRPCSSNAHCERTEYCQIESGLCQGTGHCHPIDNCGRCMSDDDRCKLCGCDGNTYPDQQTACLARANVVAVFGAACGETVTDDGNGGGTGRTRTLTPCASDEQCPDSELCCGITGVCYPTSDPDRCRPPPEGTTYPCTSDAQCPAYQYCLGDGCDGPGGCVRLGPQDDCGVTLEPACGCDGVTYTSAECADSRGVRVAHEGECSSAE
jgi:hypothetical protein